MKIEKYLASLPQNIISGQDVQLPDNSFRAIFDFVDLGKNDIFYHLGCGDGKGLSIALEEYNVKKAVGIDNDKSKIDLAHNLKLKNCVLLCEDILSSEMNDATVILFWFTEIELIEENVIPND